MKKKRSYQSVALRINTLCSKPEAELTEAETRELYILRRALSSRGINSTHNSITMMDYAIVADNLKLVQGYLSRHEASKVCRGKNIGRINANKLEAVALKELGLSTTDHRRIAKILTDIATCKKAIDKKKRVRAARVITPTQAKNIAEDDEFILTDEEREDINEFARKAFSA